MKNILLPLSMVAMCAMSLAAKNDKSDPVLMTIDGRDVPVSEFNYLYSKNNSQQVEPQTVDKYVDMFVDYKLKVADAIHAGIDTTKAFRDEFAQFRNDLARPYLRSGALEDQLAHEAYQHMSQEVCVAHIMFPYESPDFDDPQVALDNLRSEIVKGNITFEDAAEQHSMDKPSARQGGKMGWIAAGAFPYEFEKAAYDTPVGEICAPINSGFGWHIIRVLDKRPARGEVNAQHILVLTRGKSPAQAQAARERIDSLYAEAIKPGADFDKLAEQYSEDPGSAQKGGRLDWFGSGMMVPQFDSVAFAMPVGAVSEPFETAYGYHIIKKLDARGVKSFDEALPTIKRGMERDGRSQQPAQAYLDSIATATGSHINPELTAILTEIVGPGDANSAAIDAMRISRANAFVVNGVETTLGDAIGDALIQEAQAAEAVVAMAQQIVNTAYNEALTDYARTDLERTNNDYRNLVNEYRDGILLFEISNRNVWDRAATDKAGLEEYFQANRSKYSWDKPRFKSYVIFAQNDSVLNEARQYADELNADFNAETFVNDMRQRFGRNIKVERVIAAEGENAITDYLGFGAARPENAGNRWNDYFAFRGKVIDTPEEATDVRGAVVADYQASLEKEWLKRLHKNHKVKINKKELKKVTQK